MAISHGHRISEFRIQNSELKKQHKMRQVDEYVLGTFGRGEAGKVRELIKRGSHAIQEALEHGMDAARSRFNTK